MPNNASSGLPPAELFERAVAALVREWGVDEATARATLLRECGRRRPGSDRPAK